MSWAEKDTPHIMLNWCFTELDTPYMMFSKLESEN